MRAAVPLLLLTLAVPMALAVNSAANLTVGALTLPPDATSGVQLLAFVHNDARNLSLARLESPTVTFCTYEAPFAEVANPDPLLRLPTTVDAKEACFPYTAFSFTMEAETGWIALRSSQGASAEVSNSKSAKVEPRATSTLASLAGRVAASDDGRKPWFHEAVTRNHLLYSTPGLVAVQGGGEFRFMGPTIHVEAAENKSTYKTGEETRDTMPNVRERVMRWIVITYDSSSLNFETTSPFVLAAREAPSLTWDGNATAARVRGYLTAEGTTYAPQREGAAAYLDGAFTGSLRPTLEGDSAQLRMEGTLRGTSLRPMGVKVPAPSDSSPIPWLLFGAAVLVTAGGAVAATSALLRRRHRRRIESLQYPYNVEDCKDAAMSFMEQGKYARALPWLERARLFAPRSGVLAAQEAFCHAMLGHVEEAVALYAEADRLSPGDGEAAMGAARLLRAQGPSEEAYRWLRVALEKTPEFVVDVREVFPEILGDPKWAPRLEKARRAFEKTWTDRHG